MERDKGKFVKGKAPGRPKGTTNHLTKTVKEAVLKVFNELEGDPKNNLRAFAKKYPRDFYNIAAKLIPTEITGKDGDALIPPILSDTQFESILSKLNGKAKTLDSK